MKCKPHKREDGEYPKKGNLIYCVKESKLSLLTVINFAETKPVETDTCRCKSKKGTSVSDALALFNCCSGLQPTTVVIKLSLLVLSLHTGGPQILAVDTTVT